jgi:hypothetical protein
LFLTFFLLSKLQFIKFLIMIISQLII